jgi:hypothetical protein
MNDDSTPAGQDYKPIAIIAVVLVSIIGGGLWWFSRSSAPTNTTPQAVAATEAPIDAGKQAPPVALPPLEQMDSFLKPLLQALSNRPELARWLATDDLVRQLAMALDQAATGSSPARDFKVLKPAGAFAVSRRGVRSTIDPASYRRYDGLVQTVTSIDAARVAEIYKTIRPRLNEAYQQAGNPGGNVESAVIKTLDILIETPVVKDPVAIVDTGGAWAFDDEELEALLPTQKQLLRMGPANVEKMLVWLRALREAI